MDGWHELPGIATFRQGNWIDQNTSAACFDVANLRRVKNRDVAVLSSALSFGDVQRRRHISTAAIGKLGGRLYRAHSGRGGALPRLL
jgi:hypothetical protein